MKTVSLGSALQSFTLSYFELPLFRAIFCFHREFEIARFNCVFQTKLFFFGMVILHVFIGLLPVNISSPFEEKKPWATKVGDSRKLGKKVRISVVPVNMMSCLNTEGIFFIIALQANNRLGPAYTTAEKFENKGFILETHQMFSVHTMSEEFKNPTITDHFKWIYV